MDKVKLSDDDWKALLPERQYQLGKVTLSLRPLSITEIAKMSRMLSRSIEVFKEKEITLKNYQTPENMAIVVDILMSASPEIISDCIGLETEDVKRLPIDKAIDIIKELIELNLEAKTSLMGNLQGLTTMINDMQKTAGKLAT